MGELSPGYFATDDVDGVKHFGLPAAPNEDPAALGEPSAPSE